MENKRILVIGGTGYIGREIVSVLSNNGYIVSVLSRHPTNKNSKDIIFLKGDVLVPESLSSAMQNIDVVLYLPAIIRSINKRKYKQNHIGLKNTIKVIKQYNVKRIIYFSTINVIIPETGHYGNSKKLCEKIVVNSALDYMIIRPNYVYGIDKKNDFYRLYKIMRRLHICPIIGEGKSMFEPVNKKDVALLTLELLKKWQNSRVVHLSGKEKISLNELVHEIKNMSGIASFNIHLPINLLKIVSPIIPFDVDGYDKNRIANADVLYGESHLKNDLKTILSIK